MRTIGVSLRPHDERNLRIIMEYLSTEGLNVGKATVSQAVRYAIGYCAQHCRGRATVTADNHTDGHGHAVTLQQSAQL